MAECCCNPFNLLSHNWSSRKKNLRLVQEWMFAQVDVPLGSKICDSCRKKLSKLPDFDANTDPPAESDASFGEQYVDAAEAICSVNKCLLEIGPMPVHPSSRRIDKKMKRITGAMKSLILETPTDRCRDDESEMILQLKEEFRRTTERSKQLQILTVLLQSWTRKKIQEEFGVSDYMARKCKQLVKEKGILSTPDPKPGHTLPPETVKLVGDFYESDDISRMMTGKKYFMSVRLDGKLVHV